VIDPENLLLIPASVAS